MNDNEEIFKMRESDIEIPDSIMKDIETDNYDSFYTKKKKYFDRNTDLILVWVLFITMIYLYFKFGSDFASLDYITGGLTIYLIYQLFKLHNNKVPKPEFYNLSKKLRKKASIQDFKKKELERLRIEHDRKIDEEKNNGIFYLKASIADILIKPISAADFFFENCDLLSYSNWQSSDLSSVYTKLVRLYTPYKFKVLNKKPLFIVNDEEGNVFCSFVFSFTDLSPRKPMLNKILSYRLMYSLDKIYFVSLSQCPPDLVSEMAKNSIIWLSLRDYTNSIFQILLMHNIIDLCTIAWNNNKKGRYRLKNTCDFIRSVAPDYYDHLIGLVMQNYETDILEKFTPIVDALVSRLRDRIPETSYNESEYFDTSDISLDFIPHKKMWVPKVFDDYGELEDYSRNEKRKPRFFAKKLQDNGFSIS